MYNKDSFFELLERRKITNKALSSAIGVSSGNISDWKSGKSKPNLDAISKIADYLDCSVDYLLGRESSQYVTVKNVRDSVGVVGQANAPVTIHNNQERQLTIQEQDFLRIYNNADGKTQMKIMNFIYGIEEDTK